MTSDDDKTSEYFRALQPVCVRLTKDHSIEAVKLMQNAVKTVPQQYLQYLQSYVLFPLRIILKQSPKKPELIYRSVLQCMEYVLEKTHVDSWEMFQDLFNSLCIMLSSLKNSEEELQLDVVRCLGTMVKQLSISILNQMLSCAFLPSIGHYISLLLGVVQSQCKQTLILAALSCVQRLALSERKNVSKLLRVRAGGILASCFPGVSLAMCKLLTSKDRHGQLVIKSCLDTLTIYVTLVMSDENAEFNDTQTTVSQGTDDKLRSLLVERNDTWIESTAAKVQILLKRLGSLSNHDSWKVRIALIKLAESVLTKCQKSLFTSNSCMLEIVVNLINDDYKSVATKSKQVLAQYRSQSSTTEAELNTMLQDNLYDLATKLPRLVRVTDDASKLSTLSLFYGYLNLLGPHLNVMLYSSSHLQRVTLALVQILEFDCSHMHIIEQNPTGKVHDGTEFTQKFYFKHFIDHRILTQIKLIFQSLGKHGNIQLLVDHFLEIFHQTEHKKQAIFCINEIVLGTKSDAHKKIEIEDIICSLLEEYIAPTIWNVPTSNIARHSQKPIQQEKYSNNMNQALLSINQQYLYGNNEGHSVQVLNSNVILLCLCIDGVDIFAQVLGEDFSNHLMNILYPLMEKLSNPSSYVTQSTYTTLCSICHACKYSDVADLIESNADYLVDAICLRLRHITRHPRSPKVLIIILQYAQCSILKYLNDIIQEILYVVDEHYEDHAVELVQILYALVKAISLWFCSESEDDTAEQHLDLSKLPPQPDNSDDACAQRLVEYFTEYTKLQRESVGDVSEDEEDSKPWEIGQEEPLDGETESSHEREMEDEKKEPPPQYIDITKQVWERCVHLCSCAEPSVRLTVLKTIHEASTVLYTHQDIYLPLIHKLWPAFVCRFNDSEQLVTIQAIKTAEVLSMTAKDFLYKRICKDVIPKATSLLKKQADISIKAGPAYKYTVAARLQLSTINTLTTMAWKVGLMESPLSDIIAACVPYLNGRQPQYLQQAAVEGFHCLYEANGDMVWFVLNDVFCDTKSSNLIARGGFPYKEYRSNVQLLLDYINDKS